ncbi:MAG: hypothetical protein WBF42_14065 [Terracidiphilus sp.]
MKASLGVTLAVNAIALFATAAFIAPLAAAQVNDNDPDLVEVRHYRLTMDKLEKAANVSQQIEAFVAGDPAMKKRMDAEPDQNDASIDQKVRRFDASFPTVAAIVHRNGLSTREYIVVSLALMNDYMMVGMKRQGSIKSYPPNSITSENAAFVEQNFDKLQGIIAKMTPSDHAN